MAGLCGGRRSGGGRRPDRARRHPAAAPRPGTAPSRYRQRPRHHPPRPRRPAPGGPPTSSARLGTALPLAFCRTPIGGDYGHTHPRRAGHGAGRSARRRHRCAGRQSDRQEYPRPQPARRPAVAGPLDHHLDLWPTDLAPGGQDAGRWHYRLGHRFAGAQRHQRRQGPAQNDQLQLRDLFRGDARQPSDRRNRADLGRWQSVARRGGRSQDRRHDAALHRPWRSRPRPADDGGSGEPLPRLSRARLCRVRGSAARGFRQPHPRAVVRGVRRDRCRSARPAARAGRRRGRTRNRHPGARRLRTGRRCGGAIAGAARPRQAPRPRCHRHAAVLEQHRHHRRDSRTARAGGSVGGRVRPGDGHPSAMGGRGCRGARGAALLRCRARLSARRPAPCGARTERSRKPARISRRAHAAGGARSRRTSRDR